MKEKIEKWLDGYIAVMDAHLNYPDLRDEGITICEGATYIHLYTGFDTIADVLGLNVDVKTEKNIVNDKLYIHKSAMYKGHKIVGLEVLDE